MPNRLHVARPVAFVDWSQLAGLEDSAFFVQPLWKGRRAILDGDGSWHWGTGKGSPHQLRHDYRFLRVGLVLELTMMRGRIEVADVVVSRPMNHRRQMARASGINLHCTRVRGLDEANEQLERWMREDGCRGLVLKRADTPYPWLPHAPRHVADWVTIQEPLVREPGQQGDAL